MDKNEIFDSVEDCIAEFKRGGIVIVSDDENRENEGDMICAGEKITVEAVNTMLRFARGLICVPTTSQRLTQLGIDDMVRLNRDAKGTAFTVTVDAAKDITTGISAADRARTIRTMADANATAEDIVTPGHLNPLRARKGGVLERAGHTEAAVDLARLAGLFPCAAICEILNDDGTMARIPDLVKFKKAHNMKMMSVASLIEYRLRHEKLIKPLFERDILTSAGKFKLSAFRATDGRVHFALVRGSITGEPTLARVHSENAFADIFFDVGCKNGSSAFQKALEMIAEDGNGAAVYITQPDAGVNIAVGEPLAPNVRDYGIGAQILRALGFEKIRLLTTTPSKHSIPEGFGLEIVEEIKIKE